MRSRTFTNLFAGVIVLLLLLTVLLISSVRVAFGLDTLDGDTDQGTLVSQSGSDSLAIANGPGNMACSAEDSCIE